MRSTNNYYSETVFSKLRSATASENLFLVIPVKKMFQSFSGPNQLCYAEGHLPERFFRTTYGYHRYERACRPTPIPKTYVTPITEAILT